MVNVSYNSYVSNILHTLIDCLFTKKRDKGTEKQREKPTTDKKMREIRMKINKFCVKALPIRK